MVTGIGCHEIQKSCALPPMTAEHGTGYLPGLCRKRKHSRGRDAGVGPQPSGRAAGPGSGTAGRPYLVGPGGGKKALRNRAGPPGGLPGTGGVSEADELVTGGLPPGGSGHEGRRCSCRAPPSAGSTGAAARRAGPRRLAIHASPGTRGHTATSRGPCRQSPGWSRFRSPSLSLEGPGYWREFSRAAGSRFNVMLPAGQARGEWADCTAMVTEVCAPHKVAS
jgi:hypothetical protein